jgi:hypothetical protein
MIFDGIVYHTSPYGYHHLVLVLIKYFICLASIIKGSVIILTKWLNLPFYINLNFRITDDSTNINFTTISISFSEFKLDYVSPFSLNKDIKRLFRFLVIMFKPLNKD